MAIDTVAPRSRRVLLAATAGSLAALAAQALGRPLPTRAADPNDVVLGGINTATTTTKISNTTTSSTVFWGSSISGVGVYGLSISSIGVYGNSNSSAGVVGTSFATDQPATVGQSSGNSTGVLGYSGASGDPLPAAPTKTGVCGRASQDSGSRGVYGRSTAGRGVYGQATSGSGVFGYATSGYALRANGRVKFDTASGTETIAVGTKSKTVTPGFDLTTSTKVLVTLMANPGAGVTLHRVAVNTSADSFTIHLTADAAADTKFAWFVIS